MQVLEVESKGKREKNTNPGFYCRDVEFNIIFVWFYLNELTISVCVAMIM